MSAASVRLNPTRRRVVGGLAAAAALPLAGTAPVLAGEHGAGEEGHGLSFFGDLGLPPNVRHFAYVDPVAPKGGRLILIPSTWRWNQNPETFNTLNTLILKGDAAVGVDIVYASLLARNFDEPDAMYGLAARSVRVLDQGNTVVFRLRPEARFHDGAPITAEDVAFSLDILKAKGHPLISQPIREMTGAEAASRDEVAVRFSGKQSRGLPLIVAGLPILSKAFYDRRPFDQTWLEPPLGCGPYKVGRFDTGKFIEYERVPDWWGKDLPVCRGQFNFDTIRYEFYRERTTGFEAFKAGQYLLREEFTSLFWATKYDFPAINDGRVVRLELADETPSGAQGWFLNTRRAQFKDPRVREALGLVFDFEWTNKNIFFGAYRRTASFFEHSPMKAEGPPSADERDILEEFRGRLSEEVFGPPWSPPVSDGSGQDRALFRRAADLFAAAGWKASGGALRNAEGQAFTIEFLENDPIFNRVSEPYVRNLKRIGVDASIRIVDPAQYQKRINDFDFDVVTRRYTMSLTPDEGIRQFWSSIAAATPGSNNLAGISDPVVDALIEKIISAPTREAMYVAARVLDRVLRAGRYWVPHWHKPAHWIAMWDVYARPARKPRYARGIESTWWLDAAKAARIGKGL